jgi:hypothetical protein
VTVAGHQMRVPATAVTGGVQRLTVPFLGAVSIRAVDEAGNLSFPVRVGG